MDDLDGSEKLPSGIPFRTGSDYFDDFNSRLLGRISDLEEIKAMAPVLFSLPKYNPFVVPADYFEELPAKVTELARRNKKTTSPFEWFSLLIRPRFILPVAATLLIAIAGIKYMNSNAVMPKNDTEELSLEEHLYDIDESTIIDQLTAEAIDENENTEEGSIRDYLIENNIDETNLEL